MFGITAKEMTRLETPNYLFRFFNILEEREYLIYLDKLNASSCRFDLFNLDLPNDLDLKKGQHLYFVYENTDNTNLDYKTMNLLEEGRAEVLEQGSTDKFLTINNNDKANYVE